MIDYIINETCQYQHSDNLSAVDMHLRLFMNFLEVAVVHIRLNDVLPQV